MTSPSETQYSLEIGSGYHPQARFTHHCDINPRAVRTDACCPADALPWPDATFSELCAVDVLEHISYRDSERTLLEWRRVLAPGGRIYIQVPDTEAAIRMWQTDPNCWDHRSGLEAEHSVVGLAWVLLGGHIDGVNAMDNDPWWFNAHASLWTQDSLAWYLKRASFEIESIETNTHPNVMCWAVAV